MNYLAGLILVEFGSILLRFGEFMAQRKQIIIILRVFKQDVPENKALSGIYITHTRDQTKIFCLHEAEHIETH